MAIEVLCTCGNTWKAGDGARGMKQSCPRCKATIVIGQAPPNIRLKLALAVAAGRDDAVSRRELFAAVREGTFLVPMRKQPQRLDVDGAFADAFFKETGSGARALIAFTDEDEVTRWNPRSPFCPAVELAALMAAMADVRAAACVINSESVPGLFLAMEHFLDLIQGKDPKIGRLADYITTGQRR